MAVTALGSFSQNEIDFFNRMSQIKYELDKQSYETHIRREGRKKGYNEGIKKGLEKGRKKANLESARKMKADNMSVSQINKYTGLSVETITQL